MPTQRYAIERAIEDTSAALYSLYGIVPSRETAIAKTKLEEARVWLREKLRKELEA
jgi:hypothetical protein